MTALDTNFANAFETRLTADMLATDIEATVASTSGLTSPCYLVIEPDSSTNREVILFDGTFTGTKFRCSSLADRYLSGSAAASGLTHRIGSKVRCSPLKQHFDDIHDRIDEVAGGLVVSVTDLAFGAVGDGVTDDTAAIQAAIDYVSGLATVGVVRVPASPAPYLFSTLTIPDGIAIRGDGYGCSAQSAFGSSDYDTGNFRAVGSVLRSTATSGAAITFIRNGHPYRMSGLCVAGPGSGTSTGVLFGDGADLSGKHDMSDVMVVNFSICWDIYGVQDSLFSQLRARGCHTGFRVRGAGNQNVFLNTEVQFSDTDGIVVDDATANQFIGGLLQNTSGTASLRIVSGEANVFQGFYHESSTPPDDMILISTGAQNVIRDWWFSSPSGQITLAGGGTNKLENLRTGGPSIDVVCTSVGGAILIDVHALALTGATAANCRIVDFATGFTVGVGNGDIRVPSGNKVYFETAGTGSYIARDGSTGDTIVSSATGDVQILSNIKAAPSVGTKIGTATTEKLGFYGVTPVVQQTNTADLRTALIDLGFLASGGASPLNLNGGKATVDEIEIDGALNHDGSTVGFFGVAPTTRPAALTQTYSTSSRNLGAYTADVESSAYTGIDNAEAGTVFATVADLNALRVGYENLRAFVENLAQHHNAVVDDLQSLGLEQ